MKTKKERRTKEKLRNKEREKVRKTKIPNKNYQKRNKKAKKERF